MDLFAALERLMRMDERTWQRHASPWSVWTRVAAFPLLVLAIWSRVWIGWGAAPIVATMAVFLYLNPRLFPPPRQPDNWASKATFGERVYLARKTVPIPPHHERAAALLTVAALIGAALLVYGLIVLQVTAVLVGLLLAAGAKLWFVDRMVWLFEDMSRVDARYRAWLTPGPHPQEQDAGV
ncbi:MAG: DUF6653 family protein [Aurantimonas endophytica]|uniref:Uncharacterized protein n=1 Tax=Aurantimonas endophytica TaxID=1522175 RepID=A0A7W6MRW4_9HYPH|nr:DUF6653 family protein [Aurantimonas endophytica]MBB4005403.1 hypothetical protein [Aurantimonas endophytica]